MRRGVWLLVFGVGVVAAVISVGSARAGDTGTTTSTTTTGATTTTPPPTYAPLSTSSLPAGCVGAGAAALALPSHRVIALGTPAANLGPSAYPASASVVAFDSSTATGSTCTSATVTLASVSLFGGAVTATRVEATGGKGTVTGLEIDGTAVSAAAGQVLRVEGWGQLTLGAKIGRSTAPLVLRLLQARDSLPAGTSILVAFAATPRPVTKPKTRHHKTHVAGSLKDANAASNVKKKHQRKTSKGSQPRHGAKSPPDFPSSPNPFLFGGALAPAVQDNQVVSTAMRYLGIPYTWGGATPKTGFDCSGLVTYVFAQLGVSLPHYAAAQWYSPAAFWVRPTRLRAGDLVFFTGSDGTRKMPGHVGIYVGDGYLIDAPHTGAFVRVDSLDERWFAHNYVGAKRVVGASLGGSDHRSARTRTPIQAASWHLPLVGPNVLDMTNTAASVGVAGHRSPRQLPLVPGGAALGGLLLVLGAGGFVFRRRHSPK